MQSFRGQGFLYNWRVAFTLLLFCFLFIFIPSNYNKIIASDTSVEEIDGIDDSIVLERYIDKENDLYRVTFYIGTGKAFNGYIEETIPATSRFYKSDDFEVLDNGKLLANVNFDKPGDREISYLIDIPNSSDFSLFGPAVIFSDVYIYTVENTDTETIDESSGGADLFVEGSSPSDYEEETSSTLTKKRKILKKEDKIFVFNQNNQGSLLGGDDSVLSQISNNTGSGLSKDLSVVGLDNKGVDIPVDTKIKNIESVVNRVVDMQNEENIKIEKNRLRKEKNDFEISVGNKKDEVKDSVPLNKTLVSKDKKFDLVAKVKKNRGVDGDDLIFNESDSPTFEVQESNNTAYKKGLVEKIKSLYTKKKKLEVTVRNSSGETVLTDTLDSNNVLSVKKELLKAGKYTLSVFDPNTNSEIKQDFYWGVLAINVDRSIYKKGQVAEIYMSVLDDKGSTVCNADVNLQVVYPSGKTVSFDTSDSTIDKSSECGPKSFTYLPDYSAVTDQLSEVGQYKLIMTASNVNGERVLEDSFVVEDNVSFDVKRIGPTRIYPKENYVMKLEVIPSEDYKGEVKESLPFNFKVVGEDNGNLREDQVREIIWNVDWKAGQKYVLEYEFDPPNITPDFFLLGPLQIGSFQEARSWHLASDTLGDYAVYTDTLGTHETDNAAYTGVPFNNVVSQSAIFTQNANDIDVALGEAGRYLFGYTVQAYSSSYNNRISYLGRVTLAGTEQLQGHGQGVRRNTSNGRYVAYGFGVVNASATDNLRVEVIRQGTYTASHLLEANRSSFWALKLDDSWDYLRLQGADNQSTTVALQKINFTTLVENTNTSVFTHSTSVTPSDITLNSAGHYLVVYSVEEDGATSRTSLTTNIALNNVPVEQSYDYSYLRGVNGLTVGVATNVSIINAAASDVLTLSWGATGAYDAYSTQTVATGTSITVVKLPDTADYLRVHETGGGQTLNSTSTTTVLYDTQDEADSGSFSYNTTSAVTTIQSTADYLFTSGMRSNRGTSGNVRLLRIGNFYINGTRDDVGGTGVYVRGDQSTPDTFDGGWSAAGLFSLSSSDTVDFRYISGGQDGNGADAMQADSYGITAVNINSLTPPSTINLSGHVYTDEGTTALDGSTTNKTVNVRVNGSGTDTTEITTSDGAWSVTGLTVSSGDVITVYLDGETEYATTVLVSDGTTKTDIDLYQNKLILRDDVGSGITNANLNTGYVSDTDVLYTNSAGAITIASSTEMHVWTGDTYTAGNTISSGTSSSLHVDNSATAVLDNNATFSGTVTVDTGATLTSSGTATFTSTGAFTNAGTLTLSTSGLVTFGGDFTNTGTINENTSSVKFTGTAVSIDSGCSVASTCTSDDFYNVELDGSSTFTLGSDLKTVGTFTITNGELIQTTYTTYLGGAVSVASGGIWTNTSTGDITLGSTFANAGTVTLQGNGATCGDADSISITSTVPSTQRAWSGAGTFSIGDVSVQDMGGTASITVGSGTSVSGNGANWTFAGCPIDISGTMYSDHGVTPTDGSGTPVTVQLRVNGTGTYSTSMNVSNGAWSITGVAAVSGDIITVYADNSTQKSTTVYISDGTSQTNVDLYYYWLIVRDDVGSGITNTNLSTADDGDTDVKYQILTGELRTDTSISLHVWTGDTFLPGDKVTASLTGGGIYLDNNSSMTVAGVSYTAGDLTINTGATLTVNSDLSVSGDTVNTGTLSLPTSLNTVTLDGNFTNTGTINESTSKVIFGSTSSVSIDAGCSNDATCTSDDFYDVEINGTGGTFTLASHLKVNNALTITYGELVQGTYNIRTGADSSVAANGVWTNTSTGDIILGGGLSNAGTVTFQGNGATCGDADAISLTSTVASTQRAWSGTGTFHMNDVSVQDMGGTASITVYSGTSVSGNDVNWTFAACLVDISGHVYTDEGVTPLDGSTTAKTINLSINGSLAGSYDIVASDGAWSVTGLTLSSGDLVLAYINGETDLGTTVFVSDGTTQTNVDIYTDTAIIRDDAGSGITTANLVTADDGDPDIIYFVSVNDLVLSGSTELHVWTGDTFLPNGKITLPNLALMHLDDNSTLTSGGKITVDGTLDIDTGATLTLNANDLTVGGNIVTAGTMNLGSATLSVDSDFTNTGVINEGTSTFGLDSATTATVDFGCSDADTCSDQHLHAVGINNGGAYTLASDFSMDSFSLIDGSVVQGAYNARFNTSYYMEGGSWSNTSTGNFTLGGDVDASGGTMTFDGSGVSCGDVDAISITSTSSGVQRSWSGAGVSMTDVSLQDQGGTSAVTVYSGTNVSGNGSNFAFTNCPSLVNISGHVYTDEGTTALDGSTTNKTVNVRVNGSGTDTTEITTADGAWAVTGLTVSSGDVITIYLDGETEYATTVLVSDGTTKTDIDLYQNKLILRDDVGGGINNSSLNTGYVSDTDVLYTNSAGAITIASNTEMHVWTGDTYTAGNTVSSGTSSSLHVDDSATAVLDNNASFSGTVTVDNTGVLTINGGTFTSGGNFTNAGTLNLISSANFNGNFTNSGTINENSSNVSFGGADVNIDTGCLDASTCTGDDLYWVEFDSTGIFTLTSDLRILNEMYVTNGELNQGIYNIYANGVTVDIDGVLKNTSTGDFILAGWLSNAGEVVFQGNGLSCGDADAISITSTVSGTQRAWSGSGTFDINDVSIQDMGMYEDSSTGVVGQWKLDENALDSSGNGYDGTVYGDVYYETGKLGQAGYFDGTGDYVSVSGATQTNVSSSFSTSVWINPAQNYDVTDTISRIAFQKEGTGQWYQGSIRMLLVGEDGSFDCQFYDGSNYPEVLSTTNSWTADTWYHVACVFDDTANTLSIYVNGTKEATTTGVTTNPTQYTGNVEIGGASNQSGESFLGDIDDARFYNKALSDTDVSDLYDGSIYSTITVYSGTNVSGNDNFTFAGCPAPPNNPSSLVQAKTDDTSLATGDWTDESSVKLSAQMTDPNASDTLYLCVEVDPLGTAFSDTEDSCGTGVAYSGSAVSGNVTISGLSDGVEYHWQARTKDLAGTYSAWVSYDVNLESARDVGVDTSAPTGGTVYDGTNTGVDTDFGGTSLSSLSANWSGVSSAASGLSKYEYSIGTTVGGTDIKTWTDNGTSTSVTATGLTLQTSVVYYFNVRTTDVAGNVQSPVITSDGQLVAPSLVFTLDTNQVVFSNLNDLNSYTDTKTTTLTTSTNAYNGYVIRSYITDLMTSTIYPSETIPNFNGGTYASPGTWGASNRGFGYTSSDTSIQGSNKFASGTLYAPFATTGPGDIVADHVGNVSGSPISNENFTITYKVQTDSTQVASPYSTTVVYTVTAQY